MGGMFSSPETPKMPAMPEAPSLGSQYAELFNLQKKFLPQKYAQEAQWGPLFNQLDLQNQRTLAPQYQQLIMDLQKRFAPQQIAQMMALSQQFAPQLMQQQQEQQNQARNLELQTIQKYGPQLKTAIEGINPQETKMRQLLGGQAAADLALGSQLNPQEARNMQQAVRMGQTARGMTQGQAPLSDESRMTYEQGQNLKNQRTQGAFNYLALPQFNALQALNLGQNPYNQANQITSGMANTGTQGMGMVPNRGPQTIDMSPLGQMFGQNSQNWAQQNQNTMQGWNAQNQFNQQNQGSPWMNMLPMAGMGAAMGAGPMMNMIPKYMPGLGSLGSMFGMGGAAAGAGAAGSGALGAGMSAEALLPLMGLAFV